MRVNRKYLLVGLSIFVIVASIFTSKIPDLLTVMKVNSIKNSMDKVCDRFGYYEASSVMAIDRNYPPGAYDSNPWMDIGCVDQNPASGEWPSKCTRGFIDYTLGNNSNFAPGVGRRTIGNEGSKWYDYSYQFECNK